MRRLPNSTIVLLALAFALIASIELSALHLLLPLENRVSDYFVRTQALTQKADPDIVIVDIDEKSLASMAESAGSWPWPRSVHGELVEAIERQQPKAIVFDILFTDPDIYRPESDAYFNAAVAKYRNIYFPMIRLDPAGDKKGMPIAEIASLMGLEAMPDAVPDARIALAPPQAITTGSWRLGTINYDEDSDGIGRNYHIYLPASGWRIPSLPTRLARDMGFDVPHTGKIILGWRGGTLSHPHISYADLYLDASRKTPLRSPQELKNKIVIIGASASGLHDIRSTPISSLHPAQEILATAIDNLKNKSYFHAAQPYFALALALSLIALLLLLFIRFHQTLRIGAALLVITAMLLGASYFAVNLRWLVPVFLPLLFAWSFYFAAALHEYLRERKAREQTVQMFNRFLDPRVVHELMDQGQTAQSMSGKTQTVSVLFSDIRNFTTYSEKHSAEQVVAMLNRYFSLQVEVIFRHGGTLDKFIGDAIMAFWGAPAADPDHAANAVAAALEMAQRLEEFKHELGDAGAAFDVGIGIHSGPAVVGFIGSERRQDYTAIGDTVNLSSRIEGQTKGVARILVSEETCSLCADKFDFIDHGFYKVKGRTQETHLFEPRRKTA
ncbi:MAG: adenylate/guanylate cyclase domain-containing protein [Sulfuricella denitrificans]|nr:adenylate/guanylate cyclase domain-containing protein [Sulfuricella denitrificans]